MANFGVCLLGTTRQAAMLLPTTRRSNQLRNVEIMIDGPNKHRIGLADAGELKNTELCAA
jgi:hypothetical protein